MSESTLIYYLNKCQQLQRYAEHCDITIRYTPHRCVYVEILSEYPYFDRSVFEFTESATDEENEKVYQLIHNIYERT